MNKSKDDYLMALARAGKDVEAYQMIEALIEQHFSMVKHMKETSLYDVYMYEKKLAQPIEILVYDNEKLKKEVNKLRRQLGLIEKYKEEINVLRSY